MRIIGLDIGRHRVKWWLENFFDSFPSYVGAYRQLKLERVFTKEDMIVEVDGARYFVGSVALDESEDGAQAFFESKVHQDTQILGLAALARCVNNDEEVVVVTGQPIRNHVTSERRGIRELFMGAHEVTVNGKCVRFYVAEVIATAECACVTCLLPERHKYAYGIDGGGATTNLATWKNGVWVDRLSDTLTFGCDNSSLSIDRYARMVAIGATQIVREWKGPIYVIGGVADALAKSLKLYIRNVPIVALEQPSFANAKAYYTVGVMMCERRKNV